MTCCDATVMVGDGRYAMVMVFLMSVGMVGGYTSATADAQWHVLSAVCKAAMQLQAANTCNSGSI